MKNSAFADLIPISIVMKAPAKFLQPLHVLRTCARDRNVLGYGGSERYGDHPDGGDSAQVPGHVDDISAGMPRGLAMSLRLLPKRPEWCCQT